MSEHKLDDSEDPRFGAAVNLLQHTGATSFRIGYSDPDDGDPTAWYALVTYPDGIAEAAGAITPLKAVLRLCTQVIDGGQCTHCGKRTIFAATQGDADDLMLQRMGCMRSFNGTEYVRQCSHETQDPRKLWQEPGLGKSTT
jgi:hypothetical protein